MVAAPKTTPPMEEATTTWLIGFSNKVLSVGGFIREKLFFSFSILERRVHSLAAICSASSKTLSILCSERCED